MLPIGVIVTKELLYRFVHKTGQTIGSQAVKVDAFHHRSDAITSLAAFIGISIALIGGTGYEVADDYAALFAAAIIVYNAYKIARPAVGELLDEALEPEFRDNILAYSEKICGVKKVEKCFVRKMGTAFHIDLHIWVNGQLSVEAGHAISHRVKDNLLKNIPQIMDVLIHVEPNDSSQLHRPDS